MAHYNEFSILLQKLQCKNRYNQSATYKETATIIQEANRSNLLQLMELLVSTQDLDVQVKLISVLAAYLVSNGVDYEVIVKYNPLYDSIQDLLIRGLPLRAATALNFIVALLCFDEGDRQTNLAMYARNMLRVSSCLNTMCDIFAGSMMYQDTWMALCQALAETCRGCDHNQNYCSHLISVCVRRCRLGNVDVCTVLLSLLRNNERNMEIFINSEGLNMFTRQLLQYNICMQLLSVIVESSAHAVSILRTTEIVYHLQDFLHLYGSQSQMGQWSTVILYKLGAKDCTTSLRPALVDINRTKENNQDRPGNQRLLQSSPRPPIILNFTALQDGNSVLVGKDNPPKIRHPNKNSLHSCTTRLKNITKDNRRNWNPDNTANLFQNVINEVNYWKAKRHNNVDGYMKTVSKSPNRRSNVIPQFESNFPTERANNRLQINHDTEYRDFTFSFLCDGVDDEKDLKHFYKENTEQNRKYIGSTLNDCKIDITDIYNHDKTCNLSVTDMEHFKPPFISTPKRSKKDTITMHKNKKSRITKKQPKQRKVTNKSQSRIQEIRHRSMSARLFNAINESCTTFVKSVKSIFRPKQNKDKQTSKENTISENEGRTEGNIENDSCSYSFTNYMRKRDALLENVDTENEDSTSGNYKVNSCKTCKDTVILQNKMASDDRLKKTINKLKIGMNLYGCDFKKISKAIWPRDRYMTSDVLYNLYRKLILNGGHDNHEFRQKAYDILHKEKTISDTISYYR